MLQRVDMKIMLLRLGAILLQYMAVYKLFIWSFGQYRNEIKCQRILNQGTLQQDSTVECLSLIACSAKVYQIINMCKTHPCMMLTQYS